MRLSITYLSHLQGAGQCWMLAHLAWHPQASSRVATRSQLFIKFLLLTYLSVISISSHKISCLHLPFCLSIQG